uniref:Putative secreted protein n=1 Tax=Anopheles triannulatus TaxID=58253 RepID=A0A2M4B503_9DIPT
MMFHLASIALGRLIGFYWAAHGSVRASEPEHIDSENKMAARRRRRQRPKPTSLARSFVRPSVNQHGTQHAHTYTYTWKFVYVHARGKVGLAVRAHTSFRKRKQPPS